MAAIHQKLLDDCFLLGRFPLCHLLLMNETNYPWFILVPDREAISEIYQLNEEDQKQLIYESSLLGESLMQEFNGDKLNVAALGNVVPQCHVHHIVRYHNDPAWPALIWGKGDTRAYSEQELETATKKIRSMKLPELTLLSNI